jgi:hypothetical protein
VTYFLANYFFLWHPVPQERSEEMPRKSPFIVRLTSEQEAKLQEIARKYTSPYCDVVRAKAILYAAEGLGNDEIADRLDTRRQIISKWRKRFYEEGMSGLEERPRHGRPGFSPRRGDRD